MTARHSISIETRCPKKLEFVKGIITNNFKDKVSFSAKAITIDSPDKAEIGKLAIAFRIEDGILNDNDHPLEIGTEIIGHLRAKDVECRRAAHIDGMLNEDRSFNDVIELG